MTVKDLKRELSEMDENTCIYIDVAPKDKAKMEGYGMVSWDFSIWNPKKLKDLAFLQLTEMISY